jgi:hypothetical protein
VGEVLPVTTGCMNAYQTCGATMPTCTGIGRWGAVVAGGWNAVAEASDDAGDVVMVGHAELNGVKKAFVAYYQLGGNLLWSKEFVETGNGDIYAGGVAFEGANVIVAGNFNGTVDFGSGPQTASLRTAFVLELNALGGLVWLQVATDGTGESYAGHAGTDAAGNIYLEGSIYADTTFAGQMLAYVPSDGYEVFVAKLSPSGTMLWSHVLASSSSGIDLDAFAVDAAGDCVIGGWLRGAVDPGGGSYLTAPPGATTGYVVEYGTSGALTWNHTYGTTDGTSVHAAAFDGGGELVLTGELWGSADFGGGVLTSKGGANGPNVFVVKLDAGGAHRWSELFGDLFDRGYGVAVESHGEIALVGQVGDRIDFGPGTTPLASPSTVPWSAFVAKLDPTGTPIWADLISGPGAVSAYAAAILPVVGDVIVAADVLGTSNTAPVSISAGSLTETGTGMAVGVFDLGP